MDKKIEELKKYCEKYGHWVKITKSPKTPEEKEGNNLYYWLRSINYYNPTKPFKYADIRAKNNLPIRYILDDLFLEYGINTKYYNDYIIRKVREIITFCTKYNIWPIHIPNAKNEIEALSNYYAEWLDNASFRPHNKFYQELLIDGKPINKILDELYEILYVPDEERQKVLRKLAEIKEYCVIYRRWPTKNTTNQKASTNIANDLASWLDSSGYYDNFKYNRILDEYGTPVKVVLDNYYHVYNKTDYEDLFKELDIWKLKDSPDKIFALAGLIIELSKTIYSNYELFDYYVTIIKKRLQDLHLNLDIKEIITDLTLSINEQAKIYYKKYLDYQDKEPDLAKLYLTLFKFANSLNESINEEKEEKRRK